MRSMNNLRAILIQVIFVCGLTPAAFANCEAKNVFATLADQTEAVLALHYASRPEQIRDLERTLAQFDGLGVRSSLQSHDLGGYVPLLYRVLADIRALAEDGPGTISSLRPTDLRDVEVVLDRLCGTDDAASAPTDNHRQLPLLDEVIRTFQFSDAAHGGGQLRSYLMLGSLPFVVFVTCSIIFVLLKIYRFCVSLIYLRRRCRIPASLHVGPLTIDGHVTILGTKGSRFEAKDGAAINQITQILEGRTSLPETSITVGDIPLKAHLHQVNAPVCVTLFDKHVPRKTLNHLFSQSRTEVRFEPKTATRSNLSGINPMLKPSAMRK